MNICKITHYKCDDIEGYTYLIVPDNKTQKEFRQDVNDAQNEYLEVIKEFKENPKITKPSYMNTNIEGYPDDLTVKQIKDLVKTNNEELNKYRELYNKVTKSFSDFMVKKGYKYLWDPIFDYDINVYWGHRHEEVLDISNTEIDYKMNEG